MTTTLDEMFSGVDHLENISSRVMVNPGEHLIQGNGHARRTSHPG
jgi:hypothetical protein